MPAELHYAADIGSLCRRREIADGHVLDHTATERAHLGHLGTSCPKGWAVDTLILADRRRPSRPLSFCRDSGFVQSRGVSIGCTCRLIMSLLFFKRSPACVRQSSAVAQR